MATAVNTGMTRGDMRKMLVHAKEEPIGCAVGLSPDAAAPGLLMLHRSRAGRAVEKMLKDECPDFKATRFGTASVDEESPKLVKLTLNRALPGIARKLIKTLKGTGFNKVLLVGEDGETLEAFEEEDDEEAAVAAAPGAIPDAPPPPAAGQSPEDKAAEAAALAKQLAALAPLIPKAAGNDDERRAMLVKLATDVNVNIKTGNLRYAADFLAKLKAEMEGTTAGASTKVLAAARLEWTGTRQRIEAEVGKLRDAIEKTYAGQPFGTNLVAKFETTVAPVLEQFNDRLADSIDEVMNETDVNRRDTLVIQARGVVKDYLAYAMTEPLIADLDANPFVPLTIRSNATKTLASLAKAIH